MQAAQAPVPSQQPQLHGRRSPSPPGKPMFKSLSWQQPRQAPPSLKKQRSAVDTFKIPAGLAPGDETARRQTLRDVRDALAADSALPVLPEVYTGYNCDVQVCAAACSVCRMTGLHAPVGAARVVLLHNHGSHRRSPVHSAMSGLQ